MRKNKGFTLIELMIVVAIIAIIAAIAIPSLLGAKKSANEANAIGSLRTLSTALEQFRTVQIPPSYPAGMANLLDPNNDGVQTDALIDNVLGAGAKNGYAYTYVPADPDGDDDNDTYTINADPSQVGTTGERQFFMDQSGVIRVAIGGAANVNSQPIE